MSLKPEKEQHSQEDTTTRYGTGLARKVSCHGSELGRREALRARLADET